MNENSFPRPPAASAGPSPLQASAHSSRTPPWIFGRASAQADWSRLAVLLLLLAALLHLVGCGQSGSDGGPDEFLRLTNLGKSQLDRGDGPKAVEAFQRALALNPTLLDAQLNVASALLLANRPADALAAVQKILEVEPNSAAAHFIAGCAHLRLDQNLEAVKSLQLSQRLDPAVTAVNFQLGLAHERAGQVEEAIAQWQTAVEFDPDHPAAHYRLSQILQRAGRADEAAEQLKLHQAILTKRGNVTTDVATFEKCKHTAARLPFKLEQPRVDGIPVKFTDATAAAWANAAAYHAPVAVLDVDHNGRNSLFAAEGDGFRLLLNNGAGHFEPVPALLPGVNGANYRRALVGDLQNDRYEDVIVLGEKASHVFKFATNQAITEITRFAGLKDLVGSDGVLLDFDFTGKLGLMVVPPGGGGCKVYRNLGNAYFTQTGVTSGLPAVLEGASAVMVEDWNADDLLDVLLLRTNGAPAYYLRQRGGPFAATNLFGAALPTVTVAAPGDLNNDLRPDLVTLGPAGLEVQFGGALPKAVLSPAVAGAAALSLVDYDNDGWLDVVVAGAGVRVWRNVGQAGFKEVTTELGLGALGGAAVASVEAADFDGDCDTDFVAVLAGGGLRYLRNDGGSAQHQLKLRLSGNRSNASALGVRLEVSAGGLRAARTVQKLPVEIGLGQHGTVDSVAVRWFDGLLNNDEIKVDPCAVVALEELQIPTGSCPYLYAWDGGKFRFVTDLLGASPLGLRVSENHFVDADPRELVWIGPEGAFPARDGRHRIQITEELREVLYLDEVKLAVVDHPPGTEVHSTSKLRPGAPFPPHELITLDHPHPLRRAIDGEGRDVTGLVAANDGRMLSPRLRRPQLRGLAEPHSVTLDFGLREEDRARPLVLALTGWLRFGGGMANVAGSQDPDLPFPFPTLEAEVAEGGAVVGAGRWLPVDVVVGTPAGKTKTIVVDLAGKLPAGTRRLRLSAAFELHWDRIALFERADAGATASRVTMLPPDATDLHGRGYSEFAPLSWQFPLTPDYDRVRSTANWRITPSGWCTKYGAVDELVRAEDNALVLVAGGDELTVTFAAARIPAKPAGFQRDFYLYTVGWDKDADFHCELGWQVEPLPWHGMDSQRYGHEVRPAQLSEDWARRWNTRWVGPQTVTRR